VVATGVVGYYNNPTYI